MVRRGGALDVRAALDTPPRPSASDLRSLEYLLQAAEAVEVGLPVPAQLMDILEAGSSAGGARPKATVRDDEGGLWLAKFPARNDTFDVARAEACTLELARNCGLTVPEVRHCDIGQRSVMLIRRFDRFWAPAGQYPAAGPLLSQLELWLHHPNPQPPKDVGALLAPYRDLPPDAVDLPTARGANR